MEPGVDEFGGGGGLEMGFGLEEIHGLIAAGRPLKQGSSSFTALLELPPPQAVELLVKEDLSDKPTQPPFFPCAASLSDRASKFSVSASADDSLENTAGLSGLSSEMVKQEPLGSNFHQNSSSNLSKRKHGEKEVKEANKRIRKDDAIDEHGEKLPYVHVRARRGQATDSHSLAERARREKINARMKLLQELVPGCNKISGTALVLDEIINHVQALQRQVEFLSMTLAAVDPGIDFNLDCLLGAEIGTSSIDNSHSGLFPPEAWLENPMKMSRHQYQQPWNLDAHHHHLSLGKEEDLSNPNFSTPENSLLSYGSPANSASQHSNRLKTEL